MSFKSNRTAISRRALLALACLAWPDILLAEVSDKEPTAGLFWQVGLIGALLCLFAARLKPWLGGICFAPAAIWFATLFMEIHSTDVRPYLRLEQGDSYYLQAYAAFAFILSGLIAGYLWHRRGPS